MWGKHGSGAHRFMAFDKKTGETVYVSAPGGRPYDTTYAPPIIANVNGTRLLIQGASDGVVHAIKPQTGEPVWKHEISKRGLNTGVVVHGTTAILTHSEENLESNEMGMMVAVDATAKGRYQERTDQVDCVRLAGRILFTSARWRSDLSHRQRRQHRGL